MDWLVLILIIVDSQVIIGTKSVLMFQDQTLGWLLFLCVNPGLRNLHLFRGHVTQCGSRGHLSSDLMKSSAVTLIHTVSFGSLLTNQIPLNPDILSRRENLWSSAWVSVDIKICQRLIHVPAACQRVPEPFVFCLGKHFVRNVKTV